MRLADVLLQLLYTFRKSKIDRKLDVELPLEFKCSLNSGSANVAIVNYVWRWTDLELFAVVGKWEQESSESFLASL